MMSTENQELSKKSKKIHRYKFHFYLLLLVITSIAIGVFGYQTWEDLDFSSGEIQVKRFVLSSKDKELQKQKLEIAVANQRNQEMTKLLNDEIARQMDLEKQLAFYKSIISTDDNTAGLAIHGLDLAPSAQPNQYSVKLTLTQLKKELQKNDTKGRIAMAFVGTVKGVETSLDFAKLSKTSLDFSFQFFQIISADITLPKDFILTHINVKAYLTGASKVTAEQSFNAADLLKQEARDSE